MISIVHFPSRDLLIYQGQHDEQEFRIRSSVSRYDVWIPQVVSVHDFCLVAIPIRDYVLNFQRFDFHRASKIFAPDPEDDSGTTALDVRTTVC